MNKLLFMMLAIMVIPLTVFALTGEGVSPSSTIDTALPEVTVNYPNGGEELYIGDTANITWNATDLGLVANPIKISYSNDNGNNYSVLDSLEANDGVYSWELPSTICYNNLIKITAIDNFGNVGADSSDAVFSINYAPPAAPKAVNVDISNEIDAVISWTEVDTTILGTPINVDGYIVLYNETAYEDSMQSYYYLANTDNVTTTYTHLGVARFRDHMFYKVVAYKDYRGDMSSILANLNLPNVRSSSEWLKKNIHHSEDQQSEHSEGKISWQELQRRLK